MSDDLRARMRAVFAGKLSDCGKGALQRYSVDSAKESLRYSGPSVTQDLPNKINAVTRARAFPTDSNVQPGKAEPTPPSMAYRVASAAPCCRVTIVEIPATGLRYRRTYAHLQLKPPAYIEETRWQQCIEDGRAFLHQWGEAAQRLGWTSADLFGLHTPPAKPHPSYSRLSRYDCTGLCWLLQSREVLALTEATATIKNPISGSVTVYRRHNKPALGQLGDSLDDLK